MRVLLISSNHLPKIGGITLTTHQLSKRLVARGHAVAVLTRPSDPTLGEWLPLKWHRASQLKSRPVRDMRFSYEVYRAPNPASSVEEVCNRFAPDVIIVNVGTGMQELAYAAIQATSNLPTVVYFHDLQALSLLEHPDIHPMALLTVGPTLTEAAADRGVRAITIPPLIELKEYESSTTRRCALFINPSPLKGAHIAWALAGRRPDVRFVFLESWRFKGSKLWKLLWRARQCKNVQIRRAERDPAKIYADAKILLAPYGADEGFCRVIPEAQALGIPAIATDVPTLRNSGGDGAIYVLPQAPIEAWAQALSRLWDDPETYQHYADAAHRHANRIELDPNYVVELFEGTIAKALDKYRRSANSAAG